MDAKDIDVLNLKAGRLNLFDDPPEGARRVGTREDILVHEEAPDEVLVLPGGAETGDLEDEDTVVVEEVIHLAEEGAVAADADVLGHLERHDLGVRGAATGDIAVVEAEDASTRSVATVGRDTIVAELGLVLAEGDTGDLAGVVLMGERGESTPTTADIEEAIGGLEVKLVIRE